MLDSKKWYQDITRGMHEKAPREALFAEPGAMLSTNAFKALFQHETAVT